MRNSSTVILQLSAVVLVLTFLGFLFENDWFLLIGACSLLGIVIKSTDQLIDVRKGKEKKKILFLAVLIPIIVGYLAFNYEPVFGMVVGTGLGLLFSGKFDHFGYYLSFFGFLALVFLVVFLFDMNFSKETFYLIPVAFTASFLDEYIHEKTAKNGGFSHTFFEHRPVLKIAALLATVAGMAEMVHLFGFLFFDISYDFVAFLWRE